jgi:hypothetical protein
MDVPTCLYDMVIRTNLDVMYISNKMNKTVPFHSVITAMSMSAATSQRPHTSGGSGNGNNGSSNLRGSLRRTQTADGLSSSQRTASRPQAAPHAVRLFPPAAAPRSSPTASAAAASLAKRDSSYDEEKEQVAMTVAHAPDEMDDNHDIENHAPHNNHDDDDDARISARAEADNARTALRVMSRSQVVPLQHENRRLEANNAELHATIIKYQDTLEQKEKAWYTHTRRCYMHCTAATDEFNTRACDATLIGINKCDD